MRINWLRMILAAVTLAGLTACQAALTLPSTADHNGGNTALTIRTITEPSLPEYRLFFKAPAGIVPEAYVWYTPTGGTLQQPLGAWASTSKMAPLGNDWYMADLLAVNVPATQTVGVIFKSGTTKLSGTADLSRLGTGWCRMVNGVPTWTNTNPEAAAGTPILTLTPTDGVIQGAKTLTVTVNDNAYPVYSLMYSVGDVTTKMTGTTINLDGNSLTAGQSYSVMVKAVNLNGQTVIGPFVYTKPGTPVSAIKIYFKSAWTSAAPTIWLWEGTGAGTTAPNRAISQMAGFTWPGPAMTKDTVQDWWYWSIPTNFYPLSAGLKFKFNQGAEIALAGAVTASKWYNGTAWTDSNPDLVPTISASPAGGYFATTQTITLNSANPANAYYQLNDDAQTAYNNGQTITIGSDMANGDAKKLTLTSDDGKVVKTYTFTKNTTFNGIKVYVKGYSNIYYWATTPATAVAATTWPGVVLGTDAAVPGWKYFAFNNVTSTNLIFNAPDGSVAGLPAQTPDQTRTTGSWWYVNGTWLDHNPDAPVTPVVTASPGSMSSITPVTVSLTSSNTGDKIYYTLDGTTPTLASTLYSGPLTISSTKTLKALGVNINAVTGAVATYTYTVDANLDLVGPTMTANPAAGIYQSAQLVTFTMKDNKAGTSVAYYTTDGTTPTTSSPIYTSGDASVGKSGASLNVAARTTFQFLMVDAAGNKSYDTFAYQIGGVAREDFRQESIYFVITSRFVDGDPSNNVHGWDDAQAKNPDSDPAWRGDFKGLIQKLDYIKALGFTAIWITPVVVNASGYDYHGYHASNFKKVDPRYLSGDTNYQTLIDAVHAKGMKIIQDIVLNHTSNFGEENLYPMFKKDWSKIYNSSNQALSINADKASDLINIAPAGRLPANYATMTPGNQYGARIAAMKDDAIDVNGIYHHEKSLSWESYTVQTGQIAGDCVDLNTENPTVAEYLRDAYYQYIDMGVDSFRVDTVKHVSRLTFNKEFIPQFKARGGDKFYIFGEVCTRYQDVWNSGIPAISTPFYTWKENKSYAWSSTDRKVNEASVLQNWTDNSSTAGQRTSSNVYLNGNAYRPVDYSQRSGFDVIDFPMHWAFRSAGEAFGRALQGDQYYNDASWNVTYVASHDYSPDGAPENQRFAGSQATWAENTSLMFTFRGIPCIYNGDEIEFQKGMMIDVGPNAPLSTTGRAYFGDQITGTVTATDFGKYTGATGNVANALNHPLAQHIRKLNLIRNKVPALQMGQYSTADMSGANLKFKRRYTDATTDSFALVTISGDSTFNNIPNGTYREVVTGASVTVSNGSLTTSGADGMGNLRVYVLYGGANQVDPGKLVDSMGTYIK